MARADVYSFGLLNRWPSIVREDIWAFNQFSGDGALKVPYRGNMPYVQSEREGIATALHDVAQQAAEHLGFSPRPTWVEAEPVYVDPDARYDAQTYTARWGYIEAIGKRATSEISSDVEITYSDTDEDGIRDTATLTVTTDVDVSEIEVFFRTADGAPSAAHARWQIEGLTVTKSGNTVTITGHAALFAHPRKVWALEYDNHDIQTKHAGDPREIDHFVTHVDVYRVYADPTQAVQVISNPRVVGEDSAIVYATADITNARAGYFTVRTASDQTPPSTQPRTVKIWYKAGLPLEDGNMNRALETAIVRYTNVLLPQEPAQFARSLAMWAEDNKAFPQPLPFVPIFGLTNAGVHLARIVDSMQSKLKGKPVWIK